MGCVASLEENFCSDGGTRSIVLPENWETTPIFATQQAGYPQTTPVTQLVQMQRTTNEGAARCSPVPASVGTTHAAPELRQRRMWIETDFRDTVAGDTVAHTALHS